MRGPKPFFRKQTQTWYVQIGGKQYNLGPDEESAKQRYHELMLKARGGQLADDAVASVLNRYLAWCEANLAPDTFRKNLLHLRRFGQFVGASLKVSALKPYHVTEWVQADYAGKSDTYRNDAITTAKGALQWAVNEGYIDHSPIARVKKPARAVREFFVPSERWPEVLEAIRGKRFRDYVAFMLSTGSRPQEIRKIEARHFDRPRHRLVFPIPEAKGKKKQRIIYLDEVAMEIVERLVGEFPEGPIFRNSQLQPWEKNAVKDRFKRLQRKLKMPGLTATTLRHSWAHHKLATGTDSLIVSKLMGHVDGRMLATRYGHVEQNEVLMLREATRTGNPLKQ